MDPLTLFGVAAALGMDALAVAAAVSAALAIFTKRHTFRLVWHFGLFQAMMTTLGWLGGATLSSITYGFNNWIAVCVLCLLGANMIRQSFREEERVEGFDPTRGWSLVGLSVATSIDAFAAGMSLGLVDAPIVWPSALIGVMAAILTYIGILIGRRVGSHLGEWAERIGGLALIALGLRVAIQTMAGS